jgi:hypothetical protein
LYSPYLSKKCVALLTGPATLVVQKMHFNEVICKSRAGDGCGSADGAAGELLVKGGRAPVDTVKVYI